MFCPNCGTNNPDGSKFCGQCGTVFNAEAEAPQNPVVTEEAKPAEKPIPEQTVDQIIEEIAPKKSAEPIVSEQTVDQIINEIVPEQPAAQEIPEQPAAQEIPEQPAAQTIPEQPVAQTIPEQPAAQTIPEQPMPQYQQPMPQYQQPMPQYQQPAYASPYPQQPAVPRAPRKPMDPKTKKKVIIGASCGAVLAAFLIVLFAAIIPNAGLKGKLRHTWTRSDSSRTYVMDLKSKSLTIGSKTYSITNWKASGDRLEFTYIEGSGFETETYVVAFSPDRKKLYLFDAYGYSDGDRPDMVFVRGNYKQSSGNDLLW